MPVRLLGRPFSGTDGPKWPFLSQKGYAVAILTSQLQQDQVAFLVSCRDGNKKFDAVQKSLDFGPKKCIFVPKISFFSTLLPNNPLFHLRWTLLNGIITSTCPEVTLDTFGFPVGDRSAARRVIFWHRWPFLSQKCYFSAQAATLTSKLQLD